MLLVKTNALGSCPPFFSEIPSILLHSLWGTTPRSLSATKSTEVTLQLPQMLRVVAPFLIMCRTCAMRAQVHAVVARNAHTSDRLVSLPPSLWKSGESA